MNVVGTLRQGCSALTAWRIQPSWWHGCVLTLLSLLSVTISLWLVWPQLQLRVPTQSLGITTTWLPWITHQANTTQQVIVEVTLRPLTATVWRVVPDDELISMTINGRTVPLDHIPKSARSDWQSGFEFDFSPWLQRGNNSLEFVIVNHGGDGQITLHPVLGWRWLIVYLSFVPWLYTLGYWFKLKRHQVMPIAVALVFIMAYWSVTPWTVRTHDVLSADGHLAYIQRIVETHTLPKPTENWELFQAPLYYLGGAAVWLWADWLHLPTAVCLQAYALLLWLVFLSASSATLQLALRHRQSAIQAATASLALWPSGIMHSLRIGNDLGMYACAALAMFFLLRWWQRNRHSDLLWACGWIACGLITKSNIIVLAATASLLMVLRLYRRRGWRSATMLGRYGAACCIMAGGALLYLGRNLLYYWRGEIPDWLTGSSAQFLGDWLKVPDTLNYFVTLNLGAFLTWPWLALTDDASGRAWFWNTLLRSALSGEFSFSAETQRAIAYVWGGTLLALLVVAVWQARWLRSAAVCWRQLPWLLVSALWIASLMSFRHHVPYACNNDFRYIAPVLVALLVCVSAQRVGQALLSIMVLGSMVFFLTLPYG